MARLAGLLSTLQQLPQPGQERQLTGLVRPSHQVVDKREAAGGLQEQAYLDYKRAVHLVACQEEASWVVPVGHVLFRLAAT